MTLKTVSLNDKYDLGKTLVFLSGIQVLVRLMLMQKARDEAAGLNTAGYVSGYRGSPLGGLDQQFTRAKKILEPRHIVFLPGLNEDLAATALWGTQQAEMRGDGAYDGVFGMWYGKGPGVDRCGDVFRHANAAGTSEHGGVLVLMGDDHGAESSTVPHQSEFALVDAMMPMLNPAGVQEILDYGQLGIAMSRYSGCWIGLKCVHDTVESTTVIDGSLDRLAIAVPQDFKMPEGGLNIRPRDDRFEQERRLHLHKRFAAVAFARANHIDRLVFAGGPAPKIGIISTGKSYLDLRQALDELGIDEVEASRLGLRLLKIGLVWPLDPRIVADFAAGLDLLIVVEEKRSLLETQLREQLCNSPHPPVVIGKKDEAGNHLFPAFGTLEPNQIALAIGERMLKREPNPRLEERMAEIRRRHGRPVQCCPISRRRIPYFCAGCPHNSSTVAPRRRRAAMPGSAATGWCSSFRRAIPKGRPIWVARAPTGSARRRSPTASTSSRISATAPITIPAARDPGGNRGRRQHHLQDPLQRCRRDDRRPAGGHQPRCRDHRPPGAGARGSSASPSSPTSRTNIRPMPASRPASPSTIATTSRRSRRS